MVYQLVCQLFSANEHMPFLMNLVARYDAVQHGNFTTETLVEIILLMSTKLDTMFLVFDGVDEMEKVQTHEVLRVIKRLADSESDIRCLLLSQHTEVIRSALRPYYPELPFETSSVKADIERFIESHWAADGFLATLDTGLQKLVKRILIEGADGRYIDSPFMISVTD